ncbi:hypothetical protein RJ640_005485 [Escallonia rubra]|uniref:Gnk2-homologous domain-containing protein n=1 Tax=Escallonia rubra TaxID=112253 RepID=A0AA88URX9_9ASTE|nr:hypothetical protein RJ640_005485 [Escallonia rubra]
MIRKFPTSYNSKRIFQIDLKPSTIKQMLKTSKAPSVDLATSSDELGGLLFLVSLTSYPAIGFGRWVLFLFHFFLHLFVISLTIAQPNLQGSQCTGTVNYTQDSAYPNNLDNLLYTLSTKTTSFSKFSSGQTPDVANGIALCRGDVDPDTCRRCVDDSTRRLKQLCPNQKEAIGYYEFCTVRYSNRFIFGIMETAPRLHLANTTGAPNVVQFNQTVVSLLVKLNDEAARSGGSTRKFATGKTVGPDNLTIYGLVQCTPDISGPQCSSCLDMAMEWYPSRCCGQLGCRILSPSCNFRYEITAFYNESPADALPPAAPPPATPPTLHAGTSRSVPFILEGYWLNALNCSLLLSKSSAEAYTLTRVEKSTKEECYLDCARYCIDVNSSSGSNPGTKNKKGKIVQQVYHQSCNINSDVLLDSEGGNICMTQIDSFM